MNFASVLKKRYEHSRFAHFYTNCFALIPENFAKVSRYFAKVTRLFAKVSRLFAKVTRKFAKNIIVFVNVNEPNRLSYFLQLGGNYIIYLKYKDGQCSYYVKTIHSQSGFRRRVRNSVVFQLHTCIISVSLFCFGRRKCLRAK